MSQKVTVDNLTSAIMKELNAFQGQTEETCEKAVVKTANEAVTKLKNAHPAGSEKYGSWDKYNSSWTVQKDMKKAVKTAIVHNKKHYRLTHLLEKGHALRQGGRTRAFPHIEPVADFVNEEFYQELKRQL